MNEKNIRWDKFVNSVCFKEKDELSPLQIAAMLCFWYDAEMNSGGHSGYFDCYPGTNPDELAEAITVIANKEIADNYRKAIAEEEQDGYISTDMAYYAFSPSLCDYLMDFVEENQTAIFFDA